MIHKPSPKVLAYKENTTNAQSTELVVAWFSLVITHLCH